jgi:N-acetylglucosamine malate deacetylase 1
MNNKNILVLSPHADDATIFVGGTLAKLAEEGHSVYIARVTNDDFDSCGMDVESTIIKNREEAEVAYRTLGACDVIHMGYKSDYMMTADYQQLRRDIVELIRKIKPFTLFTFDTDMAGETNMDHKIIASAAAEALWVSAFDLHYPEHFAKGLAPYSVPEHTYFSTAPDDRYIVSDISATIDKKAAALTCHKTPVNNMLQTKLLGMKCAGIDTEEFEGIMGADRDYVIDMFARKLAMSIGESFGVEFGEMINPHPFGMGIFSD